MPTSLCFQKYTPCSGGAQKVHGPQRYQVRGGGAELGGGGFLKLAEAAARVALQVALQVPLLAPLLVVEGSCRVVKVMGLVVGAGRAPPPALPSEQ